MRTIVFVGPTLPANELRRRLPDAAIQPPAACGDVLEAVQRGFRRIALVDGYFDQRQPVWHKEILWALERGCLVYGAASMGALRAAELHQFGMVGVGRIFEWYRDGVLEADDEVAVCHQAEDAGFRPLSEALVNIRVTLRSAVMAGVLSMTRACALTTRAKEMFYPERSYEALLRQTARESDEEAELQRWLANPSHRLNQKAVDALRLVDELSGAQQGTSGVSFHMAKTEAWRELERRRNGLRELNLS